MSASRSMIIIIPQPCHEDWNKMTQQEQGRFCAACNKCVVDFTGWSDASIHQYLAGSKKQVCGRFTTGQLQREIYASNNQKYSRYLYLSLGLTLIFSPLPFHAYSHWKEPIVAELTINEELLPEPNPSDTTTGIRGQVFDGNNQPIANCRVRLDHQGQYINSYFTDKDGSFQFLNINPGSYTIAVEHSYYLEQTISISVAATKTTYQNVIMESYDNHCEKMATDLDTLRMITGKVSTSSTPGLHRDSDFMRPKLVPTKVPATQYIVQGYIKGEYLRVPQEPMINAPSAVGGTVIDEHGLPIEFAVIGLYQGKNAFKECMTDSLGKFELTNIPAGKYILNIHSVGYAGKKEAIIVKGGIKHTRLYSMNQPVLMGMYVEVRKPNFFQRLFRRKK